MDTAAQYGIWADGGNTLPPLAPTGDLPRVCRMMLSKLRRLRKEFVEAPSWDVFQQFQVSYYGLSELFRLHWALNSHMTTGVSKEIQPKFDRQVRAYDRFRVESARHPMVNILRGWTRRKCEPLSKEQKDVVEWQIEEFVSARDQKPHQADQADALAKQSFRRTRSSRQMRERTPFVLPRAQARLLPSELRQKCRDFAKAVGVAGYAVPPSASIGKEVGSFIADHELRQALEEYLQHHLETDDTTTRMIDLRTRKSRRKFYTSFAHEQLDGSAISSPRRAIGALALALEKASPAYEKLDRAVARYLRRQGVERRGVLDVRHALVQAYPDQAPDSDGAFPMKATLDTVMGEIVRLGGWTAGRAKRVSGSVSPGWSYPLRNEHGDEADIVVFPCVVRQDDGTGEADHNPVRGILGFHGPQRGLSVINLYVDTPRREFSYVDLSTLCHELGHALHFLVRPPNVMVDTVSVIGSDMVEFPSQLLENYALDPRVLARWANPRKNPSYAQSAFWERVVLGEQHALPGSVADLMVAWCDLTLHATPYRHPKVSEHYAQALRRFGLPEDFSPALPYLNFQWDTYAGYYFTYPMGYAMARYMATLHQDGPFFNARDIGRTFQSLHDQVLSQSTDIRSFRRKMGEWTGLEFNDLVRLSMQAYGKSVAKKYRQAAKAVAAMDV